MWRKRYSKGAEEMKSKLLAKNKRTKRIWMKKTPSSMKIVRTSHACRLISLLISMDPDADLDPDSHPPTNLFQKFMHVLHLFLRWTKTVEALVRPIISSFPVEDRRY